MSALTNILLKGLYFLEDSGRILTIIAMTVIVFYQVVARIVFKWSSPALEEAARFIMIWSIFIGAVVTTRENGHIRMGGFIRSKKGKLFFELIVQIVVLAFLCVFVKWAYDFAVYSWKKGMNSIVLGVPLIVVHVCFAVTGALMLFHTAIHIIDGFKRILASYRGDAS